MKLLMPIFLVLTIILILFGLTVFVAGTLIFLATQAFYDIYFYGETWIAYSSIIGFIILIPFLTFASLHCAVKKYAKAQTKNIAASWLSNFAITSKFFIVIILYQVIRLLYFKKIKEKAYEK